MAKQSNGSIFLEIEGVESSQNAQAEYQICFQAGSEQRKTPKKLGRLRQIRWPQTKLSGNLNDLASHDLKIILLRNGQNFAEGKLTSEMIDNASAYQENNIKVDLLQNENTSEPVQIKLLIKRQLETYIGSLKSPKVSLKPGQALVQQQEESPGLEIYRTKKVNFFSCMDDGYGNKRGWELMPARFNNKKNTALQTASDVFNANN